MTEPLRIIYVIHNAYGVGGTVRTIINQANAMAARGHDVDVVSMWRARDSTFFPLHERVRLVPLVDARSPARKTPPGTDREDASWHSLFPAKLSATEDNRLKVNALIGHLRGIKEGVLVCTRPTISLIVERFSDPRTIRVAQEHAHLGIHRPEWRAALEEAYKSFDALVTLTEQDKRSYAEAFPGIPRIERIPNPLTSLDVPVSDLTGKIVMSAGRLVRTKAFHDLIRAFGAVVERHPDWTLRIYGEGPEEPRLRRLIMRSHLYNHVFLMGVHDRLSEQFAKGSLLAMSSRSEGFGMVLLEAMNSGLPVVSYDCPVGPREIITPERDGLLVPMGDADSLAAAIRRLIENEELRRTLGAAARKTAANYDPDVITRTWERLFAELVAGRN